MHTACLRHQYHPTAVGAASGNLLGCVGRGCNCAAPVIEWIDYSLGTFFIRRVTH